MSPESASLHGGRPPKPSPFPLFALILLAGGAFAANAQWKAEPAWVAPVACLVGLAVCLLILALGILLLRSRRAGFLGALAFGSVGAALWPPLLFEAHLLLLCILVLACLAVGWLLACVRDGRFGRGGDLAARISLGFFALLTATAPWGLCISRLEKSFAFPAAGSLLVRDSLVAAAAIVVGMALVGKLKRWPTAEAALVLAAGVSIWLGLYSARSGS